MCMGSLTRKSSTVEVNKLSTEVKNNAMACLRDFLPPVKDVGTPEPEVTTQELAAPAATSIAGATVPAHHGITKTLTLPTDSVTGRPDFSAVVKQGENANKFVHATRRSLVEKSRSSLRLAFPSEEEAKELEEKTRQSFQLALEKKLKIAPKEDPNPKYIKYTPANNPNTTRIVKMVSAQADPMEPPRFSQKKAPMNPPSPPVPVLHSPERKLTKEESEAWKIPPVVSNWKNARGYTVPLDKRLAAQGEKEAPPVSDRLAEFADALYKAERQARVDVEKRAQLQRAVSLRQKEERANELRNLASQAREFRRDPTLSGARRIDESPPRPLSLDTPQPPDRTPSIAASEPEPIHSINTTTTTTTRRRRSRFDIGPDGTLSTDRRIDESPPRPPSLGTAQPPDRISSVLASDPEAIVTRRRRSRFDIGPNGSIMPEPSAQPERDEGRQRRDEIRRERRQQRERELKSREIHGGDGPTLKRSKLTRDRDRDLSERIALGQSESKGTGEVMYDQRLFNQGERDAGRGFGAEDGYNVYDKPLMQDRPSSSFLYRPKDGLLGNQAPSARGSAATYREARGNRPVEFERETENDESKDPYGINSFLAAASKK